MRAIGILCLSIALATVLASREIPKKPDPVDPDINLMPSNQFYRHKMFNFGRKARGFPNMVLEPTEEQEPVLQQAPDVEQALREKRSENSVYRHRIFNFGQKSTEEPQF